jgi:hypothetical protein
VGSSWEIVLVFFLSFLRDKSVLGHDKYMYFFCINRMNSGHADVVGVEGSNHVVVSASQKISENYSDSSTSSSHYNLHLMAGRLAPASEVAGEHTLPF